MRGKNKSGPQRVITPQQIRMARAGLGWSLVDLAAKAEINPNTISRYESGRDVLASKLRCLEEALIAAGVKFSEENDSLSVSVPIASSSSAKGT